MGDQPGLRGEALTGLACAAAVALLGAPVGLLWSALSPRADVQATPGGGVDIVDTETKDFITADAYLFLLGLVAGLLVGALVWRLGRRHALGAVLGLVAGAGLAAYLASRVGVLGEDRAALLAAARAGRLPGRADLPPALRARAVLLGWPAGAALSFAVLALRDARGRSAGGAPPAPPPTADPPPPVIHRRYGAE